MERTLVYKRDGKFNRPEYLIRLDNFNVVKSKETPKAYAIGTWIDWKKSYYIDCWVAKSMCVDINGKIFVPTWILDKYCDMTRRINNDYYNREYDVRDFSETETIRLKNGTAMSNIPSTDSDEDWEEEWPDEDIYWKNKFAEEERKQEEKAFLSDPDYRASIEA